MIKIILFIISFAANFEIETELEVDEKFCFKLSFYKDDSLFFETKVINGLKDGSIIIPEVKKYLLDNYTNNVLASEEENHTISYSVKSNGPLKFCLENLGKELIRMQIIIKRDIHLGQDKELGNLAQSKDTLFNSRRIEKQYINIKNRFTKYFKKILLRKKINNNFGKFINIINVFLILAIGAYGFIQIYFIKKYILNKKFN